MSVTADTTEAQPENAMRELYEYQFFVISEYCRGNISQETADLRHSEIREMMSKVMSR